MIHWCLITHKSYSFIITFTTLYVGFEGLFSLLLSMSDPGLVSQSFKRDSGKTHGGRVVHNPNRTQIVSNRLQKVKLL